MSRFDGIWRPGENSRFWHLEQHMNASPLLPCLVSGGWLSHPWRDSCSPAGQLLDSLGNREAQGFVVYFIWKHFSCGSFSPAEFDKHVWSRSSISPAGKKKSMAGSKQQQGDLKVSMIGIIEPICSLSCWLRRKALFNNSKPIKTPSAYPGCQWQRGVE